MGNPTPAPAPDPNSPPAPNPTETPSPAPATETPIAPREGSPLGAEPEPKPEGEKPESEEKPEGEKPEGEGGEGKLSPEAIKEGIELPEGVAADDALLGEFATYAAEAGFTLEQSKSLASMYFKAQEGLIQQLADANQKAWDSTIDGWKSEIDADPVIGSGNQEDVKLVLGRMMDEYGTKEARHAFEVTGAGWNPAIIRMIHKMGLALSEGQPVVAPGPTKQSPKTLGQALYPDGGGGPQPAT